MRYCMWEKGEQVWGFRNRGFNLWAHNFPLFPRQCRLPLSLLVLAVRQTYTRSPRRFLLRVEAEDFQRKMLVASLEHDERNETKKGRKRVQQIPQQIEIEMKWNRFSCYSESSIELSLLCVNFPTFFFPAAHTLFFLPVIRGRLIIRKSHFH